MSLSAQAKLAHLQQQFPFEAIQRADISEALTAELGLTEAQLGALLIHDPAAALFEQIKARLSPELAAWCGAGRIAVGSLGIRELGAFVHPVSNKQFAIVINQGTFEIIYRVSRAISRQFVRIEAAEPSADDDKKFDETTRVIEEILRWFVTTGRAYGPDYAVSLEQKLIANQLAIAAETFLVAHELGHAIDLSCEHELLASLQVEGDVHFGHLEEHMADAIAIAIVMRPVDGEADEDVAVMMAYAGAEFSLQVYRALELLGVEMGQTHPPAEQRLAYIRKTAKTMCDSAETWSAVSSFACGIEKIFDNIIAKITSDTGYREALHNDGTSLRDELDSLALQCSAGTVPDYYTFYTEANAIFARGYTDHALRYVAESTAVLINDFSRLQQLDRTGYKADGANAARNFKKFKLLFGYISGHMKEPARTIFLDALDLTK